MPAGWKTTTSPVVRRLAVAVTTLFVIFLTKNATIAQEVESDYLWHRLQHVVEDLLTPVRPLPIPSCIDVSQTALTPWMGVLHHAMGQQALIRHHYGGAMNAFQAMHVDAPANRTDPAVATVGKGIAEFQRENYERVRIYMTEALIEAEAADEGQRERTSGEALFWIAASHLADRSQPPGKSASLLRELLSRHPDHPRTADAHYLLALVEEERGNHAAALEEYQQTLRIAPAHWDEFAIRLRATQCAIAIDDTAVAAAQLESLRSQTGGGQEVRPDSMYYAYLLLRGEFELSRGRFADAEEAFIALVSTDIPSFRRRGTLGLADTYLAAGQTDSALAINTRLADADSSDQAGQQASYNVARALAESGRDVEAEERFRRIAESPGHLRREEALFELARIRYGRGDYDTARIRLQEGLAANSSSELARRTRILLGAILLRDRHYDEAAQHLEAAAPSVVERDRSDIDDRVRQYLLAISMTRSGHAPDGVALLLALDGLWKDEAGQGVLYWLGEAYYESRLYPAAIEALERLVREAPSSPYAEPALYTIGWANLRQRSFDRAEFAFTRMIKAYPQSERTIEAGLRRADCLYAQERYAEAAEAYVEAVKQGAHDDRRVYADYQRVVTLHRAGARFDTHLAAIRFQACHPDSPLVPDASLLEGLAALAGGHRDDAESGLLRAAGNAERPAVHDHALDELASLYAARRDAQRALTSASLLVDQGATEEGRQRGMALLEELRRSFGEEGASIDPRDPVARAELCLATGDVDCAVHSFRQASERSGNDEYMALADLVIARTLVQRDRAQALEIIADVILRWPTGGLPASVAIMAGRRALEAADTAHARALVDSLMERLLPPTDRLAAARLARDAGRPDAGLRLLDGPAGDSTAAPMVVTPHAQLLRVALLLDMHRVSDAEAVLVAVDAESASITDEHLLLGARARAMSGDLVGARQRLEVLMSHPVWSTQTRRAALIMLADLYRSAGESIRADDLSAALSRERCEGEVQTRDPRRDR